MSTVRMHGPLFNGRALAETQVITVDIEKELAKDAVNKVHQRLGQVLRHPTGYYESQVQTERANTSGERVTDGGVIYGPWLEGVGSRNATTRFKGYATFRKVGQEIEREAEVKANAVALKHAAVMN